MRVLYFDCSCGASGDMIVGALIDAGISFESLQQAISSLQLGGCEISAEKVKKHGIMCTQFRVRVHEDHDHPHRNLEDILEIIAKSQVPPEVPA